MRPSRRRGSRAKAKPKMKGKERVREQGKRTRPTMTTTSSQGGRGMDGREKKRCEGYYAYICVGFL